MYYAVDRFEEGFAVLQDDAGKSRNVPRSLLPPDTKQGDVFTSKGERYLPAPEEAARRREAAGELLEQLLNKE